MLIKITLLSVASTSLLAYTAENAVLVMGYNNTRINDVRKIKALAKEHLKAVTVLCKASPTADDKAAADYVIDTALDLQPDLVDRVLAACKSLNLKIVAVLPFSDQGTQLGALLAEKLHLPGADPCKIKGALDKSDFRAKEHAATMYPIGYNPIAAYKISSAEELLTLLDRYPKGLFLKPCQEGNNRGCTVVIDKNDHIRAYKFVEKYKTGGIIAEELISNAQEYSCDSAGTSSWLTLKFTSLGSSGKYRAELGYVLPAPEDDEATARKLSVGTFMADLCGGLSGSAYHNEIFCSAGGAIRSIEPNLRPAGGRIWDAAAIAFENFNPWLCWIQTMAGIPYGTRELKRVCYVGLKSIEVLHDGTVQALPTLDSRKFGTTEVVEIVWTKKVGDCVRIDHLDNTDFLGYIMAKDQDAEALHQALYAITKQLSDNTVIDELS
jgi:hypothetical protein